MAANTYILHTVWSVPENLSIYILELKNVLFYAYTYQKWAYDNNILIEDLEIELAQMLPTKVILA